MKIDETIWQKVDELVKQEKEQQSNSFLSTRVMAKIEHSRSNEYVLLPPVWKTVFVAAGLILSLTVGIATGNLYHAQKNQPDVVLTNDDVMEDFSFYQSTENQ
jgi:hypothetical protein